MVLSLALFMLSRFTKKNKEKKNIKHPLIRTWTCNICSTFLFAEGAPESGSIGVHFFSLLFIHSVKMGGWMVASMFITGTFSNEFADLVGLK